MYFATDIEPIPASVSSVYNGTVVARAASRNLTATFNKGIHYIMAIGVHSGGGSPYDLSLENNQINSVSGATILEQSFNMAKIYVASNNKSVTVNVACSSASTVFSMKQNLAELTFDNVTPVINGIYTKIASTMAAKQRAGVSGSSTGWTKRKASYTSTITLSKGTHDIFGLVAYTKATWDRATCGDPTVRIGDITNITGATVLSNNGKFARIYCENDSTTVNVTVSTGATSSDSYYMVCNISEFKTYNALSLTAPGLDVGDNK